MARRLRPTLPASRPTTRRQRRRQAARKIGISSRLRSFITRRKQAPELIRDEGFGTPPRLIGVAAKGEEPVEHDLSRLGIDRFDSHLLHKCAHFVDATEEQNVRSGFAGRAQKLALRGWRERAWLRAADRSDGAKLVPRGEITPERAHEILQPRLMLAALIALL